MLDWAPKSRRSRTIPIPRFTIDSLARAQADADEGADNPYILISTHRLKMIRAALAKGVWREGRPPINNVNREWQQIIEAAAIPHATIHDLRRSCITNWARKLPVHVVQKLAGHANLSTTIKYYATVLPADMEHASRVTAAAIEMQQDALGTP